MAEQLSSVPPARRFWFTGLLAACAIFTTWAVRWPLSRYAGFALSAVLSAAIGGLWWAWSRPDQQAESPSARWTWIAPIAVMALLAISLATLMTYPTIYTDEGWLLNTAWTSALTGQMDASINVGVFGRPAPFEQAIYLLMGEWLRVAGLGIAQGRLFMWAFLPVALIALFAAARRLYDETAAWASVLITAASTLIFYVAHNIRAEMSLIALLAVALWLHTRIAREAQGGRQFRQALLLGLLLSLSLEIHPNGLVYAFGFGGYQTLVSAHRAWCTARESHRLSVDPVWCGLALGGLLGGLIFFALRIAPDVPGFFRLFAVQTAQARGTAFGNVQPLAWLSLFAARVRTWIAVSPIEALIAGVAVLAALWRRSMADRRLLALLVWFAVGWGLFTSGDPLPYISNLFPIFALLIGGLVSQGFNRAPATPAPAASAVMGLMLLIAAIGGNTVGTLAQSTAADDNGRLLACIDALRPVIPPQARVVGEPLFWLARPTLDDRFISRRLIEIVPRWIAPTELAMWEWAAPDVILWPREPSGESQLYLEKYHFMHIQRPDLPCVSLWVRPAAK